ncbi:MAG TPA: sodium/glutamate symporter [Vicinamibacterales bacterium]
MLTLDFTQTLAVAGIVLFLGYGLKRAVPPLSRYNIPAPVVGGLLMSLLITLVRRPDWSPVKFDTTLQPPLMIAFFTTVGFGASLSVLRVGGPQVLLFFIFSTIVAVLQNVVGVAVAQGLGEHPLLGVLAGSVTLTGGPATGLAFAGDFERAGLDGAATLAVASAMVGIVAGGIIGGPVGTFLIERRRLQTPSAGAPVPRPAVATEVIEAASGEPATEAPKGEDVEAYALLKTLVVLLVAMGLGSMVSAWIQANVRFPAFLPGLGGKALTLPAYIGAMLVAAMIRNIDDVTGLFGLSQRLIDDLGNVALALFLALALMTLRLWELAGLALPLAIILVAQLALVTIVAAVAVFRLMGRDYESAVISGGFVGFMLGTTANAMANMDALVQRFGPAPRAFLIVPMVGAFFIDFTNAIIITVFLNFYQ